MALGGPRIVYFVFVLKLCVMYLSYYLQRKIFFWYYVLCCSITRWGESILSERTGFSVEGSMEVLGSPTVSPPTGYWAGGVDI